MRSGTTILRPNRELFVESPGHQSGGGVQQQLSASYDLGDRPPSQSRVATKPSEAARTSCRPPRDEFANRRLARQSEFSLRLTTVTEEKLDNCERGGSTGKPAESKILFPLFALKFTVVLA